MVLDFTPFGEILRMWSLLLSPNCFYLRFVDRFLKTLDLKILKNLRKTLLTLCESPLLPVVGVSYTVAMLKNSTRLDFSCAEQTVDCDINAAAAFLFDPKMLVVAWESIILERKVLVTSSNPMLVTSCCEFLRRIVLPMEVINTYVPFLPRQMIETLEAPFPYLLGADSATVRECRVDLSETVVIDLDTRTVVAPKLQYSGKLDAGAPIHIIAKLLRDINSVMLSPMQGWLNRSQNSANSAISPLSHGAMKNLADTITNVFIQTNLSLLTARGCAGSAPSFFRKMTNRATQLQAVSKGEVLKSVRGCGERRSDKYSLGFTKENDLYVYGSLQLLRERFTNDPSLNYLACWVEMDNLVFSVYEQADGMPLHCFMNKDIKNCAPSSMEPEGHVFEVVVSL